MAVGRTGQQLANVQSYKVGGGVTRIVFETLAEHVALFEIITNLVSRRRPVEAVFLAQKRIESVCRIELMCSATSGLSWTLRAQMDSCIGQLNILDIIDDDDARHTILERIELLSRIAKRNHLAMPTEPWPISQCEYWINHEKDIRVIAEICRADEFATRLHATQGEHGIELHTEIDNDSLTVSVICDAMTALLTSIRTAFPVLNLPPVKTESLIAEIESLMRAIEEEQSTAGENS